MKTHKFPIEFFTGTYADNVIVYDLTDPFFPESFNASFTVN